MRNYLSGFVLENNKNNDANGNKDGSDGTDSTNDFRGNKLIFTIVVANIANLVTQFCTNKDCYFGKIAAIYNRRGLSSWGITEAREIKQKLNLNHCKVIIYNIVHLQLTWCQRGNVAEVAANGYFDVILVAGQVQMSSLND